METSGKRGRAVQVDPNKPTLKAPGTNRLKLKYDEPLSSFAFILKERPYERDAAHLRLRDAVYDLWTRTIAHSDLVKPDSELTLEVGPARYCSPRHAMHFEPSYLELSGILRLGALRIRIYSPPRHRNAFCTLIS